MDADGPGGGVRGGDREVALDLSQPPQVVAVGRGLHGRERLTDEFQLPELWSLHLYAYDAVLEVDGVRCRLTPGSASLVPPASLIRYRYRGPSQHLYAHLRARPALPARATTGSALTLVMSPGADLPVITDLLESAITAAATRPERTRADVWMALLRLRDRPHVGGGAPRAADHVAAGMSFVESHLAEPLTVPRIARAVGLSPGQLTRLFRARTGRTVVGYVRERRVEHARHLLTSSTMTIGAVAATVGVPDLQAFNKTCRAVTGYSPRRLREGP